MTEKVQSVQKKCPKRKYFGIVNKEAGRKRGYGCAVPRPEEGESQGMEGITRGAVGNRVGKSR